MEVAINNELKGKDFSQVQELFIDGTVHNNVDNTYLSDETKRLLEQCVELESLSIVNWRLASLKNFPHLPKLKKLVLSNNSLRDGLHHLLEAKLNLFFLNLTHNLISKVSELICLGFFNNLQSLELMGCGVCKAPDFTTMLFRIIPSLKTLDCVYMPNGETDDSDPFNINPHSNNNNHRHTANNNGINGTARPPPQHGKLYNMGQLLKDYNENFASLYYSYSSSNSYGPQELSASDLEQMLSDIHPGGIPQAPPPPSSPKVQEVPGTPPRGRPAAETESTDDEEEHSYDEDHDEDIETLQRIADQMLRKERPTRRAAEPQSRAAYTAYQAQLSQLDDEDEEDEDDDDFRPGEEGSDHSGQSSDDEPAQEERDAPEEASNESEEEDEDEEEEEERGSPSATSQTSGTSSGSKRGRESHEEEAETTQPKKQR